MYHLWIKIKEHLIFKRQGNSIRFENLVFMYSQIISYYNQNDRLPNCVVVHQWSTVINPNTITSNPGQTIDGAKYVVNYVEKHHTLPRHRAYRWE